jgi:MoaA/NifB/PqqE/SkfB family radical SAM enzyme
MNYSILYRGPLSSCNYGCEYCPFSKTRNTRAELADDKRKLERFISWISERSGHNFKILFTPWGEALIRKYYQEAMVKLSWLPNVDKVAIQTNLSCPTAWLSESNRKTTALWTTYHPTQTSLKSFLRKCRDLDDLKVRYSVGVVGFKESIDEIKMLRAGLNPQTYLWINAYKRQADYYTHADIDALTKVDHLFGYNTKYHQSRGKSCRTGETVFSLDGDGNMYRCHFIKTLIGNIYEGNFERSLFARPCTNTMCGCHIGYVHLPHLRMDEVFKGGALERIPG